MRTIFRATYESRNFTFEAYGDLAAEAERTLEAGLWAHAREYKIGLDWYHADDIVVREIKVGVPYRDDEVVKTP